MTKRLKAYQASDGDEQTVVVFAKNGAEARRFAGDEMECGWEGVDYCNRVPSFDEYAPGPAPVMALLKAGWWFECHFCGRRVTLDDDFDDDGDPIKPVVIGASWVFCGDECCGRRCAQWRSNEAAKATMCELIYTRWPQASITRMHVYGGKLEPRESPREGLRSFANFTLPGLQHDVQYNFGEGGVLWVTKMDEPKFRELYGASQ